MTVSPLRARFNGVLADVRLQQLVIAIMSIVLPVLWALRVSDMPIEKDAAQTVQMGINLRNHGVLSDAEQAPYLPSMLREPIPAIVVAGLISLNNFVRGEPASELEYFEGLRGQFLKYQNVLWLALLCAGVFAAVRFFTASTPLALAAIVAANVPLLTDDGSMYMIDSLYTESPAAALLVWGSLFLVRGLVLGSWRFVVAAGLTFGVLSLIKAVFLYAFVGLILLLIVAMPFRWYLEPAGKHFARIAMLALSLAIVVLPWMTRNYASLGNFAVTYRGGEVLHIRAVKDRMTPTEIYGAVYFWAPWPLSGALRRMMGFEISDLSRGGRLQHLNRWTVSDFHQDDLIAERAGKPDDAIAYYRKSRAERVRLARTLDPTSGGGMSLIADQALQERAMQMIKERPWRHLLMTPLFLWRGAFFAFPILTIVMLASAYRRNFALGMFVVPSLGVILFYGLLTHFIPRYSMPMYPVIIIAVIAFVAERMLAIRSAPAISAPQPGTA